VARLGSDANSCRIVGPVLADDSLWPPDACLTDGLSVGSWLVSSGLDLADGVVRQEYYDRVAR
jgi:hypothetical protein